MLVLDLRLITSSETEIVAVSSSRDKLVARALVELKDYLNEHGEEMDNSLLVQRVNGDGDITEIHYDEGFAIYRISEVDKI